MQIKTTVRSALYDLNFVKIVEWIKIISIAGGGQVIVQITNLISGIIVIRLLPTQEYALYTLAYTMLGLMGILADGGIASSVMAQGGVVWKDRHKLGIVLVTGLSLRRKFAVVSLLIVLPMTMYLLKHHNASIITSCLITASLILPFFTALSGTLLEVPVKLHQKIGAIQRVQIVSNIYRLLLVLLTIFSLPVTYIAILSSAIPQLWANIKLRKLSNEYADLRASFDKGVEKKMLRVIKYILPNAIYRSLSSQITLWLVSLKGNTSSVAQLGALGRLAILIRSFNVILGSLIIPRFARHTNNRKTLTKRYFQMQSIVLVLCIAIVFNVWLFSDYILLIFGDRYKGLTYECVLISIEACICLMVDFAFALNSSRGIVLHPLFSVFCQVLFLMILVSSLQIASLSNVIIIGILINLFSYLMNLFAFLKNIGKICD